MARVFNAFAGFIVQAQQDGYSVLVANCNEKNLYSAGGVIPLDTLCVMDFKIPADDIHLQELIEHL